MKSVLSMKMDEKHNQTRSMLNDEHHVNRPGHNDDRPPLRKVNRKPFFLFLLLFYIYLI